jgi:hypothetical protein
MVDGYHEASDVGETIVLNEWNIMVIGRRESQNFTASDHQQPRMDAGAIRIIEMRCAA